MFDWGSTSEGRAAVANAMRLCGGKDAVSSQDDVMALANWAQNAWDYLAMVRAASIPGLCILQRAYNPLFGADFSWSSTTK